MLGNCRGKSSCWVYAALACRPAVPGRPGQARYVAAVVVSRNLLPNSIPADAGVHRLPSWNRPRLMGQPQSPQYAKQRCDSTRVCRGAPLQLPRHMRRHENERQQRERRTLSCNDKNGGTYFTSRYGQGKKLELEWGASRCNSSS